ncbi:unnamed protein product [Nesidiocoris tenuis]|uniref:IFT140 second beta-propeller domain-containing protein n=1 Tax=Nesidiocoris tenuis TaxID=355587 RepID=A0A6H5HQV4_9HEMI|nr:unnamed protein product [Nesidiocoris tenuis]
MTIIRPLMMIGSFYRRGMLLSCCGNILWFEKCNTSEYAAGGHRPTRSDAAKHYAIRKSQSKVLLFGILHCFRQLQVICHTVWRRRVKILILSPPIGDHWRGSNSRSRMKSAFGGWTPGGSWCSFSPSSPPQAAPSPSTCDWPKRASIWPVWPRKRSPGTNEPSTCSALGGRKRLEGKQPYKWTRRRSTSLQIPVKLSGSPTMNGCSVVWAGSGVLACAVGDITVRIWEPGTGDSYSLIFTRSEQQPSPRESITTLAYSKDKGSFACECVAAGIYEQSMVVLTTAGKIEVLTLQGTTKQLIETDGQPITLSLTGHFMTVSTNPPAIPKQPLTCTRGLKRIGTKFLVCFSAT